MWYFTRYFLCTFEFFVCLPPTQRGDDVDRGQFKFHFVSVVSLRIDVYYALSSHVAFFFKFITSFDILGKSTDSLLSKRVPIIVEAVNQHETNSSIEEHFWGIISSISTDS